MTAVERAVLERFKALVAGRLQVQKLILFGSRARGEADPESDVDVVVVLEGSADRGAKDFVSDCAWEAGFHHGLVLVPVVFGRKEWESGPERDSVFVRLVEAEGVPV